MGVDVSGLASERLTRVEAIDIMVDDARQACEARLTALENERITLTRISTDDLRAMFNSDAAVVMDRYGHGLSLDVREARSKTMSCSVSVDLQFPADGTGLPPEYVTRIARVREVMAEIKEEGLLRNSLNDRTRVRTVLLRGMLAQTEEGRELLAQLSESASRFRGIARGKGQLSGG